ncbi:hypothetical protein MPSEU_000426100 [Mayamaea pseudoterrestris]|nr:hypothetical protein MPSEU_000426100 [Mayamaea pseudoterrestris]
MNVLPMDVNAMDVPSAAETIIDAPSGFILKLFQMINEADNDLVKWTSKGDAFIIGSNIKRLEEETLPTFFRHNRFPSLIRQLNFYSYKKVNKERNVWIYKHELFHRDRPEDLHLIRRRTCPGQDGRKQRVNRLSKSQLNGEESDVSVEEASVTDGIGLTSYKKHVLEDVPASILNKRSRRMSNDSELSRTGTASVHVDSSLKDQVASAEPTDGAEIVDSLSLDLMTVSEVSDRLEERARKARGLSFSRAGRRSGVVTPPYDGSSVGLVTYDDECNYDSDDLLLGGPIPPMRLSLASVTVSNDSSAGHGDESQVVKVTPPSKIKRPQTPPVKETSLAALMVKNILTRIPEDYRHDFAAHATVARFCMATSPSEDSDLSSRILQVMSTCNELWKAFQHYRSALNPGAPISSMQRVWQLEFSRAHAIREFKTFAINCIQHLLQSRFVDLDEKLVLEATADLWSRGVGIGA